jgi:hypothetical protein
MKKFWSVFLVFCLVVSLFSFVFGCPTPKVTSLSVTKGTNNETVNLTITGSQFHKSTYVKLIKAGQSDIVATNVKLVSKTEVSCTLDLNGKTAGQWDVVVANIGSMSKKDKPTVLANGFTIEYPAPTVTGIQPNQGTKGCKDFQNNRHEF